MKLLPILLSLYGLVPCLCAEEVSIRGAISDGKPSEPVPPPETPELTVVDSSTRQLDVTEAPPMPGLPPVTGRISVTVRKVMDPKLPALPPTLPALSPDDPEVQARMAELQEHYEGTEMIFVSGETYDHSRSLIRIHPEGRSEGSAVCWSNLDLAHFSGFSTFRVTGDDGGVQDFGLMMGYSEIDTEKLRELLERHGREYLEPEIPELPDLVVSGPAFVLVEEEPDSAGAVATIRRMHELYRQEGERMEAAYHERVKNYEARKAFYLANPPKPKDLVLHYWRGKRPEDDVREGGGQ